MPASFSGGFKNSKNAWNGVGNLWAIIGQFIHMFKLPMFSQVCKMYMYIINNAHISYCVYICGFCPIIAIFCF